MTPVAGRITDAYQYGFVFLPGFSDRFITPGIPVNRIVGVLEKIGAGFFRKTIGQFEKLKILEFGN
jgi:hypothetical protein